MQLTGESPGKGKKSTPSSCAATTQSLLQQEQTGKKNKQGNGCDNNNDGGGVVTERGAPSLSSGALRAENERAPACGSLLSTAAHEGGEEVWGRDEGRKGLLPRQGAWETTVAPPTLEWHSNSNNTNTAAQQAGPTAQEEAADCWCNLLAKRAWKSCVSSNTSTLSCSLGRSSSSVSNLNGSSATGSSPGS